MIEKKLYCVVVTDPADVLGCLESPIIFHVRTTSRDRAEAKVKGELISEDYDYDPEAVENGLDIFTFELSNLDILEDE
jgi:hypothetical protein